MTAPFGAIGFDVAIAPKLGTTGLEPKVLSLVTKKYLFVDP